jgi:ABC-type Zn uptake system ZnuABC Zn-binding protein ZnuA
MDPHTYEPSQKQMVDIGKSDLFVYTGDNLDPVAKKIANAMNDKNKTLSLESSLNKTDLLKGELIHPLYLSQIVDLIQDLTKHEDHIYHDDAHVLRARHVVYTGDNLDPVAKKIANAMNDKNKTLSLESSLNKADLLKGVLRARHVLRVHRVHVHPLRLLTNRLYLKMILMIMFSHVWLDPVLSQQFAKDIKDELVKKDAKHKDDYEKNYKKLVSDLKDLDKEPS